MNTLPLDVIFTFFTDTELDLHRLLQGKWRHYVGHYSEGDLKSDAPIHHLVNILYEELNTKHLEELEATQALLSLCTSALRELTLDVFNHPQSPFWHSFSYLATESMKELNISTGQVTRESIQQVIENYVGV